MIPLFLTVVYACCLLGLLVYAVVELHLAWIHRRSRSTQVASQPISDRSLPRITVQLPLFNERHVAERLLEYVSRFDYPRDKLEIHVLDDSTDDTPAIVRAALTRLSNEHFKVSHIRRKVRDGYKAGALRDGLEQATGEFIAIFDADFCPNANTLRTAIQHFRDPAVAVVQLRWGFLNEGYSMLTRLQAFLLRMHFVVEQPARTLGGFFANFNGSGGVWRRAAIDDVGGWRADTLTEDLDLSYRAQLKGWRIKYLEHDVCDCELPVDMDGFRSQQFRWMKGGAQNARLYVPRILASSLPVPVKIHACAHLLASTVYGLTFGIVMSAVLLALTDDRLLQTLLAQYGPPFMLSSVPLAIAFHEAQGRHNVVGFLRFFPMMCAFLVFTLGMCLHNAVAAFAGWFGGPTEFVRTPKYGIVGKDGEWAGTNYASPKVAKVVWFEMALLAFVGAGMVSGWRRHDFSMYAVEVPTLVGLIWSIGLSLWHVAQVRATAGDVAPRTRIAVLTVSRNQAKEAPHAAR